MGAQSGENEPSTLIWTTLHFGLSCPTGSWTGLPQNLWLLFTKGRIVDVRNAYLNTSGRSPWRYFAAVTQRRPAAIRWVVDATVYTLDDVALNITVR